MTYKRRDREFESRLSAIADRKLAQQNLKQAKAALKKLAQVFSSCVKALKNRRGK